MFQGLFVAAVIETFNFYSSSSAILSSYSNNLVCLAISKVLDSLLIENNSISSKNIVLGECSWAYSINISNNLSD